MAAYKGWFIRARKTMGRWLLSYSGPFDKGDGPSFNNYEHSRFQTFFSRERAEAVRDALQRTTDAEREAFLKETRGYRPPV